MDYTAAPLEKLIEEFGKFQGVGRKGATRMAYQVLSMSDKDAAALADAIQRRAHPAAPVPHLPELYGRRAVPGVRQRQAGHLGDLRGGKAPGCAGF